MPDSSKSEDVEKPPEPWASFLRALDALVGSPTDLHCIGGFAIAMQYGLIRETADIDILPTLPSGVLAELRELAGKGSELHRRFKVYLEPVTVANYSEEYESRLMRMWPEFDLEHLRLFALEAHDLALTKLERNSDVDRQDVGKLARAGYLAPETLRARYENEYRRNLLANLERHDLTLQLWIDMCWS